MYRIIVTNLETGTSVVKEWKSVSMAEKYMHWVNTASNMKARYVATRG